jgi:2-oxoglutarate dehydrogenase E2 component (dihydrolipoamide succinyltransferase)
VEKEEKPEPARNDGREMERQTAPQISPVASRLARDKNVDISKISGTGAEGRVTKAGCGTVPSRSRKKQTRAGCSLPAESEQAPVESARVTASQASGRTARACHADVVPFAQRLLEAKQNTAMLTTFNEIDMGAVMDLRSRRNEEFQKRFGIKVGFTSFFVKAAISALKAFPQVNAEIDGDEIVFKRYYDIGMAVGSGRGPGGSCDTGC